VSKHRLPDDHRQAAMFRHPAGTAWTPRDTNALQVWTPQDVILTAQDFHADINLAETGTHVDTHPEQPWWTTQTRPNRRRRDKTIAALLLIALTAAVAVIAWAASQPNPKPITKPLIITAVTR